MGKTMADEKDDKWEMPTPVFRSTPGSLPKTLQKTISGYNMPKANIPVAPHEDDDILSVMDTPATGQTPPAAVPASETASANEPVAGPVPEDERVAAPDEIPRSEPVKVTAAAPKPQKTGGAGSFILIFLLIAALAAGLIYAIYYFLHRDGGSGPF